MYKILSKLVDECWRYSKPNQCHFWTWLKRPIFGVLDSQGSAETLVRRGGITKYHLIAYSFSNISAKSYQNRLMCIEVIAQNVIVVFFETQCILHLALIKCCANVYCWLELVAWHSGRTSVSGRRTSPVLRSTCTWWVLLWVWTVHSRSANQANSAFHPFGVDRSSTSVNWLG